MFQKVIFIALLVLWAVVALWYVWIMVQDARSYW